MATKNETAMLNQMADNLEREFSTVQTITVEAANKIIQTLESANNESLRLIVSRRVKFCWLVAHRILKGRVK